MKQRSGKKFRLNEMHAAYFPVIELLLVMLTGTRVSKYTGINIPNCYRHIVCRLNTQNYRTYRNNLIQPTSCRELFSSLTSDDRSPVQTDNSDKSCAESLPVGESSQVVSAARGVSILFELNFHILRWLYQS